MDGPMPDPSTLGGAASSNFQANDDDVVRMLFIFLEFALRRDSR